MIMMMKKRFSISLLMLVVVMIAVDFAIIRECMFGGPLELALAVLPSSNVLLLVLPNLRRADDFRRFWVMFEVVGWLMLLVVFAWFTWMDRDIVLAPITLFYGFHVPDTTDSFPSVLIVAIYMSPQLLVAWVAGWLNTRYQVLIVRRPGVGTSLSPTPAVES
jgi:hypothetical protein